MLTPLDIATHNRTVNTTGKVGRGKPIDQLMEHKIESEHMYCIIVYLLFRVLKQTLQLMS